MSRFSTKIIGSGSKPGNCVLYLGGRIMVDCGVPNKKLEGQLSNLEMVVITHAHTDHVGKNVLYSVTGRRRPGAGFRYIQKIKPSVLFVFADYLEDLAIEMGITNYLVLPTGEFHLVKGYYIKLDPVRHNVPNVAVHLGELAKKGTTFKERMFKVFHCTDMGTLTGIIARHYDVYGIEMNYDEEQIKELIEKEERESGWSHRIRSMEDHFSVQESMLFINKMTQGWSKYSMYPLHISSYFQDFIYNNYTKEYNHERDINNSI